MFLIHIFEEGCICVSELPSFVATNRVAASSVALTGKSAVTAQLTDMVSPNIVGTRDIILICPQIKTCKQPGQCYYPPQAVPACLKGNPCSFTCKDGSAASLLLATTFKCN